MRLQVDLLNDARQAAEVHRQVRRHMTSVIKPGIKLFDMCEQLEGYVRTLIEANGLEQGIAFPTGTHAMRAFPGPVTPRAGTTRADQ